MKQGFFDAQLKEEHLFSAFAAAKQIRRYAFTPLDSPFDVKFQSGSTYIIAESKVREDYNQVFFQSHGPMLELKKIEGMHREKKRIKKETGIDVQLFYFCFAKDALLIYQLEEAHHYNFSWQFLPKNSFTKEKEHKLVTFITNPTEIINQNTNANG